MEGNLQRWTGYMKGYQWRVFVLKNDRLDYYRSTNECHRQTNRRGSLSLSSCRIESLGRCDFLMSSAGAQPWYLRAADEEDRQRWITALELACTEAMASTKGYVMVDKNPDEKKSLQTIEVDEEDGSVLNLQRSLNFQLGEMESCHADLGKYVHSLQRELASLESSQLAAAKQLKPLFEKMMMVKISADTLMTRSNDFLGLSASQTQSWVHVIQRERRRRQRLEEAVEMIAQQHNVLESAVQKSANEPSEFDSLDGKHSPISLGATLDGPRGQRADACLSDDDDDDSDIFVDCRDDLADSNADSADAIDGAGAGAGVGTDAADGVTGSKSTGKGTAPASSSDAENTTADSGDSDWPVVKASSSSPPRVHRTTVPDRPDVPVNLWSIMKNCIGQDLSRIAMPVMINEPLSFLQRLCEVNLEYSDLLDKAANITDSAEQMAVVCAFAVASYSSTSYRTKKPFNPLLGETFELDRSDDLGWRCVCEQVSHHPPESALHADSNEWQFWEDYTMNSKFRGKYAQVLPHGAAHLLFRRSGHHYTWNKPVTTVHNVIVGKLWIDSSGDMAVVNHTTQDRCTLTFHEYSYFSRVPPRRVTGTVVDRTKLPRFTVSGTWDQSMGYSQVLESKIDKKTHVPVRCGDPTTAWTVRNIPESYVAKHYYSQFTCCLNEEDDSVAPTDSRRRPDQRVMELGDFDKANEYKVMLEEKQRQRRREREAKITDLTSRNEDASAVQYKPRYFRAEKDALTGMLTHRYVGGYWETKEQKTWLDSVNLFSVDK